MSAFADVRAFGAVGDGVADDRPAIQAAIASLAPAGGTIFFPPGAYTCSRSGTNSWSLDLTASNVTLLGVAGMSWLKHPAGMPATSVSLLRVADRSGVVIRDLGFDGNWGNTVGGTDSNTGINHQTQTDPKNHLVMIRGSTGVTIERCQFRQSYGDAIWIGASPTVFTAGSSGVSVVDCSIDMSARNGVTFGQRCSSLKIERVSVTNIYANGIDTEPVDQYVRNVTIEGCTVGTWWNPGNPGRSNNISLTVAGGKNLVPGEQTNARGFRISNCTIRGAVLIQAATDVVLERCTIRCDWAGYSYSPILVQMFADDVRILNNTIVDQTTVAPGGGIAHDAAISVQYYASGSNNQQPAGVLVSGNLITGINHGIKIEGTGGRSYGTGAGVPPEMGTATSITSTLVSDPSKAWTTNRWQGWRVRIGTKSAAVKFNTATDLELYIPDLGAGGASAWMLADGTPTTPPAPGAYVLDSPTGTVSVVGNVVDVAGDGIRVIAARAGMRAVVDGNDCGTIEVITPDVNRQIDSLTLTNNTAVLEMPVTPHIASLISRGNQPG